MVHRDRIGLPLMVYKTIALTIVLTVQMAVVVGIEPTNTWVKAMCLNRLAIPQYWSCSRDLNPKPTAYRADALPLRHYSIHWLGLLIISGILISYFRFQPHLCLSAPLPQSLGCQGVPYKDASQVNWSDRRGLNPQHLVWKTSALPNWTTTARYKYIWNRTKISV